VVLVKTLTGLILPVLLAAHLPGLVALLERLTVVVEAVGVIPIT
jgi:hypothetical protein